MQSSLRVLSTFCLGLVVPACVPFWMKDQPGKMEQEVGAVKQRWLDNEDHPYAVQSVLADDFVHVLQSGFVSKGDQLHYLRQHPNVFRRTKRFEVPTVRIYGEVAVAVGIVSSVPNSDWKPSRTAFTDVFVPPVVIPLLSRQLDAGRDRLRAIRPGGGAGRA
jgi:hypothetical protein